MLKLKRRVWLRLLPRYQLQHLLLLHAQLPQAQGEQWQPLPIPVAKALSVHSWLKHCQSLVDVWTVLNQTTALSLWQRRTAQAPCSSIPKMCTEHNMQLNR